MANYVLTSDLESILNGFKIDYKSDWRSSIQILESMIKDLRNLSNPKLMEYAQLSISYSVECLKNRGMSIEAIQELLINRGADKQYKIIVSE